MNDTPTAALVCPKCHGSMRSYERNGVTIDQCAECRGIFLDRGELERLIDAEEQSYAPPPVANDPRDRDRAFYQRGDDQGHHGDTKHGSKYGGRRRRGFLGELFD